MQLTIVEDEYELDGLAQPWNRLLSRSASDLPFLRHEYQRVWWSTRGGGEWPGARLWTVIASDETGELTGIAPLFFAPTREGRPGLMMIGSIEISDYLDLIVPDQAAQAFGEALLESLSSHGPAGWEVLDLYNLPEDSPSLGALEEAAQRRGWKARRERLQPCPVIALPKDYETYIGRLEKKQRHELRRKIRRAEAYPDGVTWRIVGPDDDPLTVTETFLTLMANDPHKQGFLTNAMREQFLRSVEAAQANGWLQLAFLEIAGRPAAGYLNFDYGDRIWVYNSGVNPDLLWLSPGMVLLAYLIEWAIQHGRRAFDFLRGGEDYKYRFGGVDRWVYRLTLERPGAD